VVQHKHYARKLAHTILQGKAASVRSILDSSRLGGAKFAWQGIMEYLCARSDGSLKPLLVRGTLHGSYLYDACPVKFSTFKFSAGGNGCGISTTLAGIHECCAHEIRSPPPSNPTIMSEGTCLVYRHVGHTAESTNGGRLLSGILTELGAFYTVSDQKGMALDINILEGLDLPVADFGGSSDPYAVLTIRNTKSKTVLDKWKAKTTVQKKTLNPQWNERFYLEGLSVDQELVVSIYDNDLLSSDDLLGFMVIPLSDLTVNKTVSLLVPLRLDDEVQKEDSPSSGRCLIIKVMEGEDLLPMGKRMSLDPFVSICTERNQEARVQTSHKTRTSKPFWDESLVLPISIQDEDTLLVEIWDNGGEAGKKGVVGRFTVDLSTLQVGECLDGWYNVETVGPIKLSSDKKAMGVSAGTGRGRIRLVLSREAESSQVSAGTVSTDSNVQDFSSKSSHEVQATAAKDSDETGPRLRIEITMVSALKSVEQVIGARTWGGPWTYKELANVFTENRTSGLLMASATKPLVMMIDGLQNLHASDMTCSLKWLPLFLPRNVHMILGYSSDSDLRVLENLLQRKPAIKIIRLSYALTPSDDDIGYGGEFARSFLLRTLEKRWPAANLTEVQRASLMVWIGPSCRPLMLRIISEIALCIPSSGAPIPPPPTSYNSASCIHKAFILLLNFRMQNINYGRIDAKRLWRVLDFLAIVPANAGGLSEDELHKILCEEKQKTVPGFFLAEIFLVIRPFLDVRSVGNRVVYCLQHTMYNLAIINRQASVDMFPNNQMALKNDLISFALNMSEFDHGGSINVRRLLFLPKLLKESGQNSEFEQMLGDLHQLDLKISCEMLWEVLMDLRIAGPGSTGSLEEILALTEEFAPILDRRPNLLIQQALNMPDNSMTYKQARLLYSRRKYILFSVYIPNQRAVTKDQDQSKANINSKAFFSETSIGKYRKPPAVTPSDELILHQRAMEWKIAKPWLRWCNKPQSREHCKLVFENQLAAVTFVLYCNNGSSIISVSLNSILLLWSAVTGEMTQTINFNEMGYKPVTAIALALNEKFLITGGEDGRMCRWDFVSTDNSSKFSIQSQPTYVVQLHCGRISGLSFLSNDIVVSSGDDKEVRIVETLSGDERASYTPMRMPITAFDCSPEMGDDYGLIATGSLSVVKIWRGGTMDARGSLHSPLQRRVSALKFCPRTNVSPAHARLLAVAEWASDALVWKQEGPKIWSLGWRFVGHTGPVLSLAWASTYDENNCIRLASGGLDCSVCLWSIVPEDSHSILKSSDMVEPNQGWSSDIAEKSPIASIVGHTSSVRCVAFHPQGPGLFAVSSSQDGAVCVWDTNAAVAAAAVSSTSQVIRHAGSVASVAMVQREDELLLVSGGADGTAKLWNLLAAKGRGEMMASVEVRHVASLTCVCLTASGRYFLTASADGIMKRWDAQLPYACSGQVKAHRGGVSQLRAHPIGDFLLSSGRTDGRVTLWDVGSESMQDVAILEGPATQPVLQAAFSSDGRMVITSDSTMVRLWSVELSREVLSLPVGSGQAWSHADFSSDGRYLVTAAAGAQVTKEEDRGLIVWDASKGLSREGTLTEGTDTNESIEIVAISISADARLVIVKIQH
jgi:WD40 repeat protein